MSTDDAVRATNDDATSCKRSAVDRGYWKDPYVQYFMRASERKPPEINRGYYARVQGIHSLLNQFLELTKCQCQVVNLGAGYDTTYWNLKDANTAPLRFVEVDFEGVTMKKCYYIRNRRPLLERLASEETDVTYTKTDLHSPVYHIVSADMRDLSQLQQKLASCDIKMDVPTMFIAECVLVYMTSDSSSALLKWIADNFAAAFFANYEQVNMQDKFGQVMIENLRERGCQLAGVSHCTSLQTQKQRFLSAGWDGSEAMDMVKVYQSLPPDDLSRVEKLEFLDECEAFHQLLEHYCISASYRDTTDTGLSALGLFLTAQGATS